MALISTFDKGLLQVGPRKIDGNTMKGGQAAASLFKCRAFSCDVTVAMLVFLNNGTAVVMVFLTNPPGIELYYRKRFLLFQWRTKVTEHVNENTL